MKLSLSTSLSGFTKSAVPFVGALDEFAAPLEAWSHRRKLVSSYAGDLLQGRRTSDDTPIDVGVLANGELDEAGLMSFAGANSVAVAALRGQVNGYDLLQGTADNQRIIVDAGSLVTVGGKAASRGRRFVGGDAAGGGMQTDAFTTYSGATLSIFIRGQQGDYTGSFFEVVEDTFLSAAKDTSGAGITPGSFVYRRPGQSAATNSMNLSSNYGTYSVSGALNTDYLISIILNGSTVTIRDGTHTYTSSFAASLDINRFLLGLQTADGNQDLVSSVNRVQELAVWLSDQTANEAAIRSALMA